MDGFSLVSGQVAVLFLLMGVGVALRRFRLLTPEATGGLVNLLILVVTPCLIVDVFQRPFAPEMMRGLVLAFAMAVAGHVAVIALAYLLIRHRDENVRRPLLLSAVFSNAGFMGIPLEQAILGDAGVFYGAVYVAVFNLAIWSWGLCTMCGGGRGVTRGGWELVRFLVNPGTVGLAVGLPFFLLSVKLPGFLATPVHLLAGLNTPVAMLVIGCSLGGAKLGKVLKIPGVSVAAFIRLAAYPLLMIALMYPFRAALDRNMMLALAIASAAPVAAMVPMFAAKYGRDVDVSVTLVSATTLLSILTMPPVVAFAMSVLR